MEEVLVDPKMFINKPYTKCPQCNSYNFGVLSIHRHHYTKRCIDCRFDKNFTLPKLDRKIIYLDQFVISEMMKSINSAMGKKEKVDIFYLHLFRKLDRLNKLQLIVCPDSPVQDEESRVYANYNELKRMYEQLSHGTSFYHPGIVRRFQLTNLFREWLGKKTKPFTVYDFIHNSSGLDGWNSRLIISVGTTMSQSDIQSIRNNKAEMLESLKEVVDAWKSNKKDFNEVYEMEINSFGSSIYKRYLSDLINYEKALLSPSVNNMLLISSTLSEVSIFMTTIHEELEGEGYKGNEIELKTLEFLNSELVKKSPYAIISSMLYASLAQEFTNGRKNYPSAGFFNDVDMIASYVTYCDAIFTDNECRRLLTTPKAISVHDVSNKVFSLSNKEKFMDYLDTIEDTMSDEHVKYIHEVYGEDWPQPYETMYEHN